MPQQNWMAASAIK